MRTLTLAVTLLVLTGTALAAPTAQQQCDFDRITAWKAYAACIDTLVAREAKAPDLILLNARFYYGQYKAFWRCRHKYFRKWAGFQGKAKYATSSCDQTVPAIGGRFTDNGDQTVTDNLSGLVWEKKDNLDGSANYADPHDADNYYTWSTGAPWAETGTVFTDFLSGATGLNTTGFAGANGWRLPTVTELQTIMFDFPCTGRGTWSNCQCTAYPCVDPALDAANTLAGDYWSATTYISSPFGAWDVYFNLGNVEGNMNEKDDGLLVRAVRGGL